MKKISAFTLIEVLVSLFLLGILIMGIDGLQIKCLQLSKAYFYSNVANAQLIFITNKLKSINSSEFESTLINWNKDNEQLLPKGKGFVKGTYPNVTIGIKWGNQKETSCDNNIIGLSGCLVKHNQNIAVELHYLSV